MDIKSQPRAFKEWGADSFTRAEDAAYAFGYHIIVHCREEAIATLPAASSAETRAAVEKAVDTALHNVNDMLEGFWKLDVDPEHSIELELVVRVVDSKRQLVERIPISPSKLELPIGYWKWKDGEFH